MRELSKDLENIKGDLANGYKTIPVLYGDKLSKIFLSILVVLALVPTFMLLKYYEIGHMYIYFYASSILLVVFLFLLWKSSKKSQYLILHNILKLIIVAGVFSILLIDINLVLKRIL